MSQKLFELIENMTGHLCTESDLDEIINAAIESLKPDVWWHCVIPPFFIPTQYNWVAQFGTGDWYAFEYEPEFICDNFDCDCEDSCKMEENQWILINGGNSIYLGKSQVKCDFRDSITIIPR